MKLIKVSELTGAALDWAVTMCELKTTGDKGALIHLIGYGKPIPNYSTDWSQGGPIIERECIMLDHDRGFDSKQPWRASLSIDPYNKTDGPTPLIAAMRCYVASKLDDTIEVPAELL